MSAHNRVIWSDGLFLQPQHFQQQDRHFERYVESRCEALIPFSWGFTEIEFERDFLRIGKIALRRLAGVFPDGTPFQMPDDDPLPPPIDVDSTLRNQRLFLAIPLRRAGELESVRNPGPDELVRYDTREAPTRNAAMSGGETAIVEVASLRARLLFESELTDAYAAVPVAHLIECRSDRQVLLDDLFVPTVLQTRASARLSTFMAELLGLLHQRGDMLGTRVATAQGRSSELSNLLWLQLINRYEPLLAHLSETATIHPEAFYQFCVMLAGEMATFTVTSRRTLKFPPYRHERLRESFDPVIDFIRKALSSEVANSVVAIPLEPRKFGISVAIVSERSLLSSAVFVLAARADVPGESIRQRFPAQVRVGPTEKIADLVRQGLPGVPIIPLPVAPWQLPFRAGYAYFELDQSHDMWNQLKNSGGVAIHVSGEFPGLTMEFWAIRS